MDAARSVSGAHSCTERLPALGPVGRRARSRDAGADLDRDGVASLGLGRGPDPGGPGARAARRPSGRVREDGPSRHHRLPDLRRCARRRLGFRISASKARLTTRGGGVNKLHKLLHLTIIK